MAGHREATNLIVALGLLILVFGSKLAGKSWREMAELLAQAVQRFTEGSPQSQLDSGTVKDLAIFGIICIVLALELSWLATQF